MLENDPDVREIAEATGREVVRETLLAIGLDAANPLGANAPASLQRFAERC